MPKGRFRNLEDTLLQFTPTRDGCPLPRNPNKWCSVADDDSYTSQIGKVRSFRKWLIANFLGFEPAKRKNLLNFRYRCWQCFVMDGFHTNGETTRIPKTSCWSKPYPYYSHCTRKEYHNAVIELASSESLVLNMLCFLLNVYDLFSSFRIFHIREFPL